MSSATSREPQRRKTLTLMSKRAVLSSKRKIWDSNDASIDAAQSAVDHWENVYSAMRGLLLASVHSVQGVYGAAKVGVVGIEHGLLVPVRDWVLLPTFYGVEHAYSQTSHFLQSPQAAQVAQEGLHIVRQTPFVGEPFLAPALVQSYFIVVRAWEIAQSPIPSKKTVRDTVDYVLTSTKWAISKGSSEVFFYVKRLDANITRTLMHTQWRVLGSGPYATLDKLNKSEVLDHLCERYLNLENDVARYEFAAHIRLHNPQLYKDLVSSRLLRERGGAATMNDEWLAMRPSYRPMDGNVFMTDTDKVVPLYFRLPYVNGKRPHKDIVWQRFPEAERRTLEARFTDFSSDQSFQQTQFASHGPTQSAPGPSSARLYQTVAQWYKPSTQVDVLVDQKRLAVSFFPCCPKCRNPYEPPYASGFCENCSVHEPEEAISVYAPPVTMIARPTLWRFHGPGDEVRRATWFLDTARSGLQPYSDESAAVLEDAFWFLRWKSTDNTAVLTVQVGSPDGTEQQLVQFSSLYQVTAIQKTLGGAISLFKRRVYRGVSLEHVKEQQEAEHRDASLKISSSEEAEEEDNADSWVECAKEPPVVLSTDEEYDDFCVEGDEKKLIISKEHEDYLAQHEGTLLALPAEELDLEDEMSKVAPPDNIDHLVLIVHGIGEMLRSSDLFGFALPNLSSIIECCGHLRNNHSQVSKAQSSLAPVNGRVEYLPVEWHEAFALKSQRHRDAPETEQTTMHDISLRTIPQMRAFANDTLMDVLYFMSPQHHDLIIDIVTTEMNSVVEKFRQVTGFQGKISVMGHSLGSIIAWDILDHQLPPQTEAHSPETYSPPVTRTDDEVESAAPRSVNSVVTSYPQLSFETQNAFFLGSPISVFLMIRNQHKPLSTDYSLAGCKNIFNIFHPYDPVAYRVEPLMHHKNADFEPRIITRWNGGFRVQYQTKRIWKRIVDETMKTQQHVIEVVEAGMTGLGLLDSTMEEGEEDAAYYSDFSDRRPVCGILNQGRRIDYMLQEKEIESANEYVAALNAHSAYWSERDLSLFVARQIVRSSLEAAILNDDNATAIQSPEISMYMMSGKTDGTKQTNGTKQTDDDITSDPEAAILDDSNVTQAP